jgi:hypothetical protein
MNQDFRSLRVEYLSEKLERERVKIKHLNRVLYQFENFIVNCYALYEKFKTDIELISMFKKLDMSELQTISSISHLLNLP